MCWKFNLGTKKNFEEVFGKNRWLWLVPVDTLTESGHHFPPPDEQRDRLLGSGSQPNDVSVSCCLCSCCLCSCCLCSCCLCSCCLCSLLTKTLIDSRIPMKTMGWVLT